MPNIREYTSKGSLSGGLSASERGVSALGAAASENSATAGATAAAGRTMAANAALSGNAIAEGIGAVTQAALDVAEQHFTKKDVLAFGKDAALFRAQKTAEWNKFRNEADPDDPTVAKRFNEEILQPALNEFGKTYMTKTGESLANNFKIDILHDFAMRQEADERIMSAVAAENNLTTMQNADASSLHADPSNLASANRNVDAVVGTYKRVGGLSAEQNAHLDSLATEMKRTNTLAAGKGMADANPAAFQKMMDANWGAEHLKPEDRATLWNYAKEAEQREIARKRADETWRKQQEAEAADAALVKLTTTDLVKSDGTLGPNPQFFDHLRDQYATLPGANSATYRAALGFAKSLQDDYDNKFLPVTDPSTYSDFMDRMVLPPDDPKALTQEDVYTAYTERRLSQREWQTFHSAIIDIQKDPEKREAYRLFSQFVNGMKGSIDHSVLGKNLDEVGQQMFFQFRLEASKAFAKAYKDGTWEDALTLTSKNYLGKLAEKWQTPTQEQMRRIQETLRGTTPILTSPPNVKLPQVDLTKPATGPAASDAVQSNPNARKPGETAAEWLARTGQK